MSEEAELQGILDTVIRDITKRMAGIDLEAVERDALTDGVEKSSLLVEVCGGRTFTLVCQAEDRLLWAIAEKMKRRPITDMEEAAEYTKEYFNVVCGHVISSLNRRTHSTLRFGLPQYSKGGCPKKSLPGVSPLYYQSPNGAASMRVRVS